MQVSLQAGVGEDEVLVPGARGARAGLRRPGSGGGAEDAFQHGQLHNPQQLQEGLLPPQGLQR